VTKQQIVVNQMSITSAPIALVINTAHFLRSNKHLSVLKVFFSPSLLYSSINEASSRSAMATLLLPERN
jgi:hypothetical protein